MNDLLDKELTEIERRDRKIPPGFGLLFTLAILTVIVHCILVLTTGYADGTMVSPVFLSGLSAFLFFLIVTFVLIPFIATQLSLLIASFTFRRRKYTQRLFMIFIVVFLLLELILLFLTIMDLADEGIIPIA
ncbi:hypothetical protein LZZ85_08225 [Terrimonas sp. NA20]|uniref:Uncharacterized protein n=1 Tax=Terrimonas ginsenosidimutans TaxID=2908004 RepID=A0ABS9KPR9_9BACT|nr:hypothetical protein [Terrimonas ginsenosidimutans]MCG2614265.1 hypothetical protein [Terrimonas ginsenosidimutans]